MRPLGLVEAQRTRDRFEDALGRAGQVAALHPVVVVDADAGEGGHLLATQAGDPSRAVGRQARHLGCDPRAPRAQETADLGAAVHGTESRPATAARGALPIPGTARPLSSAPIWVEWRNLKTNRRITV